MPTTYLPTREDALVDWLDNFVAVLSAHAAEWQVPQSEVTELSEAHAAFKPLHAQAFGPDRTPFIVAQKNAAKEAVITLVKNAVNYRLANPAVVSNPWRVKLGLNVRDTEPTKGEKPTTAIQLELAFPGIRRISVMYQDEGSETKARPEGVTGAVIFWVISDEPVTDLSQLIHSDFSPTTPYEFEFAEEDRGKRVYIAMRWQNSHGKGPWSPIVNGAIP